MQDATIEANGIRFHYVEQGIPGAPLVLLLHGFPEFWYSWRHQIPALSEHFRVVAPDLRGYNLTEKPDTGYDMGTLTTDIKALIEALGEKKAILVAHDWGGAIAWAFAYRYPEMLEKLVILNAPHPVRFAEELRSNPQQILKSWYIAFFQIPWLPESFIALNDYDFIEAAFRHPQVRPGSFSNEDIRQYKQAAARPGALTSAVNYYRSLFDVTRLGEMGELEARYNEPLTCPTMVIWGTRDFALETSLTSNLDRFFAGPFRLELLPDCSHWVQQEDPTEVNRLLVEFLT